MAPLRKTDEPRLAPFLKWAGGKRSLLDRILPLVPKRMDTYYEPFVGGGAVFFELARLGQRFAAAVLADANAELINCYQAIKDDVKRLMQRLDGYRYEKDAYYEARERDPATLPPIERAARTIYLNKTGFNGLYRVNESGRFNVPFGRQLGGAPSLYDPERLGQVAKVLADVKLVVGDFETVVARAEPTDFIYFDPPYVPLSATSSFTSYAQLNFRDEEQQRLAKVLKDLGKRKVRALLSNSDCPTTRRLYKGLPQDQVEVRRTINSVGDRRGPVSELLVRSFDYGV